MKEIDLTMLGYVLRRFRFIPFVGRLAARTGVSSKPIVFAFLALAAPILFGGAYLTATNPDGWVVYSVFTLVLATPPLLVAALAWKLNREIYRLSLGSFPEWIRCFSGKRSRIPMAFPSGAGNGIKAILAFVRAGAWAFLTGGLWVASVAYRRDHAIWSIVLLFVAAACLGGFRGAWRRFRGRVAVPSAQALAADPRPPMLFLRSFRDDRLEATEERGQLLFRIGEGVRFEEKIATEFFREGPVVAIGKPGEALPEVGACREYHSDDTWQGRVIELIRKAKGVVMIVGLTEALGWEIEQLRKEAALPRSFFVMPPLPRRGVLERLRRFASQMPELAAEAVDQLKKPQRLRCIVFDAAHEPIVFTSYGRTAFHYSVAIHAAFARAGK